MDLLLDGSPDDVLPRRLEALGLEGVRTVRTHANRTVMLSLSPRGVLRMHRGYAWAPDRVLQAIIRFLRPGTRRAVREAARSEFLEFPVDQFAAPARPPREEAARPGDEVVLERLGVLHAALNRDHFGGALAPITFRLSGRMKTRLGEVTLDRTTGRPLEIAISRRHLRHGWVEVQETVLHEMVHQWQAETGRPVDHGAGFRKKARAVGIPARARRTVGR
jgi:hypothetical protein